ncbi:DUF4139 domain-containing protein [Candidatus Micrarchaeota archaeon]|nr:DUF4139 domain-containing protein [Candidatus Micrarchaeota archaeon]
MRAKIMSVFVFFVFLAGMVFAASNVSFDAPVKQVTVYSNNAAFVKRIGTVNLNEGEYYLKIVNFSSSAVFESIFARDAAGKIKSLNEFADYRKETKEVWALKSLSELLNESLNRNIVASITGGTGGTGIVGKLAWFDDARIGVATSKGLSVVNLKDILDLQLPVSSTDMKVNETTEVFERGLGILVSSTTASRRQVSVSYLVSGATWNENYKYYIVGDTARGSGELQGWASVHNGGGEDWGNTTLTIVNGYPHFVSIRIPSYYGYASKSYMAAAAPMAESVAGAVDSAASAAFSGTYWKYAFNEPVEIKQGETRNYALFSKNAEFKREIKWNTYWSQPRRIYKINNSVGESWNDGTMQVYLNGEFIGEDSISYTPAEKEAEAYVADVPEIVVKKETLNESAERKSRTQITTSKYKLTVENKWAEDVQLVINDQLPSYADEVKVINSSEKYEQKADRVLEWKQTIKKGKTLEIEYTVETKNLDYY